jgi:hypothetical protein
MAPPINFDRIECASQARPTRRAQSRTGLDDMSFRLRPSGLDIQCP